MDNRTPIIERAFQLAQSGQCDSLAAIKARLKADGYSAIAASLTGASLSRQLSQICRERKTQGA